MTWTLASVLAYVALQLVFGFVFARRIHNEEDYLVAGRSLGPALSMFSVFATWFGAETCIGAAGEAYGSGLSGVTADPFGYAACLLLMGAVFAIPLWKQRLTTLADLFRSRFGPGVERLAVLVMVPTSVMWAAAQIRAFGQILGATSNLSLELAILLAAAAVIVYTAVGGMLADAFSDLVQGCVLLSGLMLLLALMIASGDVSSLSQLPSEARVLAAPGESLLDTLESWAVPVLGSVVAQELVARVVSARSPGIARGAALSAGVIYLLVGAIPVLVGLVAGVLVPGLEHPERVLLHRAEYYLPPVLHIAFTGALVSAILSTVDSALLVAGSLFAHNLVLRIMPDVPEPRRVSINRACVVAFGILAYGLARSAEGVYALVEEASALGSSGIFVCVVMGLFTRHGGARAAAASLSLGIVVYAAGAHLLELPHPYLASLLAAALGYTFGALLDPAETPLENTNA